MRLRFVFGLILFFFSQNIFADTSKPAACPSLSAIKSVEIGEGSPRGDNGWMFVVGKNKLDTNEQWTLIFQIILRQPADKEQAIAKIKSLLSGLTVSGPDKVDGYEKWSCTYMPHNPQSDFLFVVANTPPEVFFKK